MTALILSLALAACGDKDGDTGINVDTGGDGGAGDQVGPCGPWTMFWQVGAEWTWSLDPSYTKESGASGFWSTRVVDSEVWAGVLVYRVQENLDFDVEGWDKWEEQVEYRYVCDANGLQLLQMEGIYEHEQGLNEESDWWAAEFDEPKVVVPYDISVGDTWGFSDSFELTYSNSSGTRIPLELRFEAVAETTVTVPAGTFDVMQVEVSWSQDPRRQFAPWSTTAYLARGVGEVKLEGYSSLEEFVANPEFTVE